MRSAMKVWCRLKRITRLEFLRELIAWCNMLYFILSDVGKVCHILQSRNQLIVDNIGTLEVWYLAVFSCLFIVDVVSRFINYISFLRTVLCRPMRNCLFRRQPDTRWCTFPWFVLNLIVVAVDDMIQDDAHVEQAVKFWSSSLVNLVVYID